MNWLYGSLWGKLLRAPLKLMPNSAILPILSGPLRGLRWKVGAGFDAHWLGLYESEKVCTFQASLRAGDVVWDMGANVGYYSLLASKAIGPTGRVFAFEPLPDNLRFLALHLKENRANNVTIISKALGRTAGCVQFARGATRSQGRITDKGEFSVELIGGDEEIAAGRLPAPQVIKMDIEGGELEAIPGMELALANARAVFIATHGPEARALVESLGGYQCLETDEYVRTN